MNKLNLLGTKLVNLIISLSIVLTLTFGRSLMGVYIFGFRLGELIVGFLIIFWLLNVIFFKINFRIIGDKKTTAFLYLIPISFIFLVLTNNEISNDLYLFKSSSYIWTMGVFFIGISKFIDSRYDEKLTYFLNFCLFYIYITQVLTGDSFVENIFLEIADKYEPHKGSDIAMVFTLCLFFNEKYFKKSKSYYVYLFSITSLYLPFAYFKSRASFIAITGLLIYIYIKNFKKIFKIFTFIQIGFLFIICSVLFLQSIFWVKQSGIIKIYEARENVVSLVESRNKTYVDDAPSFIWVADGRVMVADGNLDWRIHIWQDIIFDLNKNNKILQGYGYSEIIPVMNFMNGYRRGLDGLNEHVHNNWFNIFARGGLAQLCLYIFFYYFLIKNYYFKYKNLNILLFVIPIMFVSFFDSSMENAHFPLVYYFFLGKLFSKEE